MRTKALQLGVALIALIGLGIGLMSMNVSASAPTPVSEPASRQAPPEAPPALAPARPDCGPDWTVASSPNVGTGNNYLSAISCVSSIDCWAAGYYYTGSVNQTLAEHWDGSNWSVVASPNAGTSDYLFGVAAVSSSDVWAVGGYNGSPEQTLVEHWNGSAWSVVASPSPGTTTNSLFSVAVVSATDVWAVGHYANGSAYQTLIEQWNGSAWSVVSSLSPGSVTNHLWGVAAISSNDVWAVGYDANGAVGQTLAEHWNGSAWSVVASPSPGINSNALWSVAAVSSSDVWAVGGYGNSSLGQTLAEHWNGSAWSIVASPNAGSSDVLYGVTALSGSNAWAVGGYISGSLGQTLVEHWDGSTWSATPSPNVGTGNNELLGVAAGSGSDVWAVGDYVNGSGANQTLVERYNPCAGSPTPTPTSTSSLTSTPTFMPTAPTATGTMVLPTATAIATATCVSFPGGWQSGPPLPSAVVRAAGVYFPANGRFYIVGGRSSDAPGSERTNPLEYDPVANSWVTRSVTYPDNHVSNMACGVLTVSGTPSIYCVGGEAAGATTATARVFSYNPVANTISVLGADNWPGDSNGTTLPGGSAVVNNKLYIIGGFDINSAMTRQTWVYDPNAGVHWTQLADYPVARGFIPVTAINGMIYTAGGADYVGGTLVDTNDSYQYNPGTGAWTAIATIPRATEETHALNLDGTMLVISGGRTPPNPSSEVDVYDLGTDSWSVTAPLVRWLRDFAADSDGANLWLAGGYNGGTDFYIYRAPVACLTSTPTQMPIETASPTSTSTIVPPSSTVTTVPFTPTATPISTSTTCALQFVDVPVGSTFYPYIRCLACRGIINGYADGTFRPGSNVTRGQLSKIISNAAGFSDPQPNQIFQDVPVGSTFQVFIGRLASRGYIGGYACGGTGEPCVPPANLPYFRPNNNATRGQIAKIDANAAGFADMPSGQQFEDVAVGSAFYTYTYRLVSRSIMAGYPCGGSGEPCIPPANLPYFRPNNNATRGQTSKIVANTFFPGCQTPDMRTK
jgi:hypothetical protein